MAACQFCAWASVKLPTRRISSIERLAMAAPSSRRRYCSSSAKACWAYWLCRKFTGVHKRASYTSKPHTLKRTGAVGTTPDKALTSGRLNSAFGLVGAGRLCACKDTAPNNSTLSPQRTQTPQAWWPVTGGLATAKGVNVPAGRRVRMEIKLVWPR